MGTTVEDPTDRESRSWVARPALAWCIRAGLVIIPLLAAWLSVRVGVRVVPRPAGFTRTIIWVAGAIALSMLVYLLVERALRRFSSLGLLFSLSLTFPDTAPSRLGAALRAGRVEDIGEGTGSERLAKLVATVTRREGLMRGHGDRVRGYAEATGRELGLTDDELHRLRWVALLHDVGKLDVSGRILDRRGPIDESERAIVQRHVEHADGYLGPHSEFLGAWRAGAADHHERWDGGGYPCGISGDEISLAGRIIAVADAYDAMTARRSYQKPRSASSARQEIVDNAGTHFDPAVVRAFLNSGIRRSRAGLGPLGALAELPAHLASLAPTASAGAGLVAASTVAVVTTAVAPPTISNSVEISPPAIERIIETTTSRTAVPTSTIAERPTTTVGTTATSSSTSTTTTRTPTTTTRTPTTTTRTPATPPTTTAAPTTTSTPVPTTSTVPTYPTVSPTTTPPTYPTTGP